MKGPVQPQPPHDASRGDDHDCRLLRRRITRSVTAAIFALLVACVAFFGGFAAFATHVSRLVTPSELGDADAIIVLTGGQARLDAAVDLLKSGKGQRLLISGVHPAARPVDLQRATGGDANLFTCCVDIDHAALDTIGNAQESAKWVENHAFDTVIVVTNNYHMPRSLLELKRLDPATDFIPYPVVNSDLKRKNWFSDPNALRTLLSEYGKIVATSLRDLAGWPGATGLRTDSDTVAAAQAAP